MVFPWLWDEPSAKALHSKWTTFQLFYEYFEVELRGTAFCMSNCASSSEEM